MRKGAIQIIIAIMSIALLGTTIIQFYYIKLNIDQSEERFSADVLDALNRVQHRLFEEVKQTQNVIKDLDAIYETDAQKNSTIKLISDKNNLEGKIDLLPRYKKYQKERFKAEVLDLFTLNTAFLLEQIIPKSLPNIIKYELNNENIFLDFECGIYDNQDSSFIILNDIYAAQFGDADMNETEEQRNLYNTQHSIQIFGSDDIDPPGSLKVFFPGKTSYLLKSVWPSLIGSILFTLLILFCFIYTINVIFRQKQVSMMKTDFINNMTHEFKTPIATISLAADSMTSPLVSGSEEKIKRFAGIIKQENKRMLNQVEKVLQMALLDKKNFQLKVTHVDMHELISEAIVNTNLKVSARGGKVSANLNASHNLVEGDRLHISNLIHNLLDNANKYTTEVPDIKVLTEDTKNGIRIIIEDNGIGMDKEALKHIFEKFYRVHTGNLHDVKGFGLGLSYVKAIVDSHQGTIDVKSELGKGSKFILTFPLKVSD